MAVRLNSRERVGLEDFVLLEEFTSDEAFVENLRIRLESDLIYTYIGPVLISVNPFKKIDIYSQKYLREYKNTNMFELPPHIFAIADNSYRNMLRENRDECILISGESGSGKTEASKCILEFIANTSPHSSIKTIKEKLLHSNGILESFGNAKTTRNDNSSRFGKYMDIKFDYRGAPSGGSILNYLLEKSRVVSHSKNERNFHIFYQLLAGGEDSVLEELKLTRDPKDYNYLIYEVSPDEKDQEFEQLYSDKDEKANFESLMKSLEICDISEENRKDLFKVVSAILHLGNLKFESSNKSSKQSASVLKDTESLKNFSQMLSIKPEMVIKELTSRKFQVAKTEDVNTPLNEEQAYYARDALAKDIYERTFNWILKMINIALQGNKNIESVKELNGNCVGILDIYGFEIFEKNGFEQFCINYCNEKLHELFIELTLKSEQDEYLNEEIKWEPISYFHNKIICDLIEARPISIIDIMDEECSRPGKASDVTFIDKLSEHFLSHPRFQSSKTNKQCWKAMQPNEFLIKHYAGQVKYTVVDFMDKNNNFLFRNLKELMLTSQNSIIKLIYSSSELTETKKTETVSTQFRNGLKKLMQILYSKEPSYVRCIKPNFVKKARLFDKELVKHQVKYLGLIENLRVRRAGFAYRRVYDAFLGRYKCLSPATWPHYRGDYKEGSFEIMKHLKYNLDQDYALGRNQDIFAFIKGFFELEEYLMTRKGELVSQIKALYKGYKQRIRYSQMKAAALVITRNAHRLLVKIRKRKRLEAGLVIRKYIIGFIHRKEPYGDINKLFLNTMYVRFLKNLKSNLPKGILDKSWPSCPPTCAQANSHLHRLFTRNIVRKYCLKITPERKIFMEEKVLTSDFFKDKKESYPPTVPLEFKTDRLNEKELYKNLAKPKKDILENKKFLQDQNENIMYSTLIEKYDRRGYKQRSRILIFTDQYLYGFDYQTLKLRDKISNKLIEGISTSKFLDGFLILHIKTSKENSKPPETKDQSKDTKYTKGDLILRDDENHIELIIKAIQILNKKDDDKFLRIIDKNLETEATPNTLPNNAKPEQPNINEINEYILEHVLPNGQKGLIKYSKSISENNIAGLVAKPYDKFYAHKDKKSGRLIIEI